MTWTVIVARAARKELVKFPDRDQKKIAAALLEMSEDPFCGDIRKLEGMKNRWRRRVGQYRIFFAVDSTERVVSVSAILRRTSTTY